MRDIISSNINAMLERAEDPEKLIKLMIQEMEDTLVEIKASCAGVMAAEKRLRRQLDDCRERTDRWERNARLAVEKGRDDLAREALAERRRHARRAEVLEGELAEHEALVAQYRGDIMQLEGKLESVREKQRVLVQRHTHARRRKRAQKDIRRAETTDAFVRFEALRNRVERMEAEADLVNFGREPGLAEQFARLEDDEEIESELRALKESVGRPARPSAQ
jgi:phage shock protein A